MTIIIGLIVASIIITVIDLTIQKIVIGTIEKPVVVQIIEEIKTIVENRE